MSSSIEPSMPALSLGIKQELEMKTEPTFADTCADPVASVESKPSTNPPTEGRGRHATSPYQPTEDEIYDPSVEENRIIPMPDILELEEKGLIFESPDKRRFNISQYACFSTTRDIVIPDDGANDYFEDIPAYLNSAETLELLGFTTDMAKRVFEAWINGGIQYPEHMRGRTETLVMFAEEWIKEHGVDVSGDDDELWNHLLNKLGINDSTVEWVMVPEAKTERLQMSCMAMIKQYMVSNWELLEHIRSNSHWRLFNRTS